jgi:hypothetical protein
MKKRSLTPYIFLIVILSVTIVLCAFTTRGYINYDLPVKIDLPDNIGDYRGFDILNCQNESCLKSFSREDITNSTTCPVCGGNLDILHLSEYQLLPKDTKIMHRTYKRSSGPMFMVSVVVGGHERRSIHKPQRCLVAQGNVISEQYPIEVEISETDSLDVMLMDLNRSKLFFAYWFTDGQRETEKHISRLFWVAWNGIMHNERRRWAYISIAVINNSHSSDPIPDLKKFISDLYPEVSIIDRKF